MDAHVQHRATNRDRALLQARLRIPRHVVYRDFPVETVVLNLKTERYHGLDPTAGRMLSALEQTSSVKAAAALISELSDTAQAEVEHDLCELCGKLLNRGLVEFVEGSSG